MSLNELINNNAFIFNLEIPMTKHEKYVKPLVHYAFLACV